jgi:hypothetical protein
MVNMGRALWWLEDLGDGHMLCYVRLGPFIGLQTFQMFLTSKRGKEVSELMAMKGSSGL